MKEMRRLLALVLCFVMLVGILPVSAFATDTVPAETSVVETTEAPTNAVEDDDVADDDPEEVIDSNIVPADNTTAPADNALTRATLDANAGIALAASEDDGVAPAAIGTPVVVIAGSDYQQSGSTTPKSNTTNILNAIKKDYATANGFIFGGDYSQTINNSSYTTSGINELKGVVQGVYGTGLSEVYVQGNHDAAVSGLTATGAHDTDSYGVFSINEDDFASGGSASSSMLTALENYLDGKVNDKYSKPIFVATHLPLHETSRNDNNGANAIFTLLNEAAGKGLNIIFLFGHNHSRGYDAYLGNGSIYLPKGSSISVEGGSTSTLNFTYMNNGYVGYVSGSACTHLTMTTFEIYEDEVIVKRYDANGEHTCGTTAKVLKAAGVSSDGYTADTTVVNSGASIKLTTPTGGSGDSGSGDNSGSTGGGTTVTPEGGDWVTISSGVGGTIYTLDTNGVTTGENYLIVSAGADGKAYALRNNNGSVARAEVTISNGQIVTDAEDIVWTYDSSKYLSNGSHSFYLSYNNTTSFLSTSEKRAVAISAIDQSKGSYSVKRDGSNYAYYLNYNESAGFRNTGSNGSAQAIYFFVESGTEAAGDALYGKIDGNLEYTVPYGADENTVLNIVKEGITILYHNGDASAAQTYPDDGEGMSWTLDPNYNGEVPGEYALSIKYNDVVLGTVKVIVPNVGIEADDILYYIDESLTAPINAGLVEGTTTGGTYAYEIVEGGDAIIESIDGNGNITFTGTEGTAQVKITYTYTEGETTSTLEKAINVTATEPYYTVDICDPETNESITAPIALKGVEAGNTQNLSAVVKAFNAENPTGAPVENPSLRWTVSDTSIATIAADGMLTFTGTNYGTFTVTVYYLDENGEPICEDTVTVSASKSQYVLPDDGTDDFPEYPEQGAIRFDKTAVAQGNFSQSGIAKVELSMTGVPYGSSVPTDVVIMVDMTTSMKNYGYVDDADAAIKSMLEALVYDAENDKYDPNIYVQVWSFKSDNDGEDVAFVNNLTRRNITKPEELTAAKSAIAFDTDGNDGSGTCYDEGTKKMYEIVNACTSENVVAVFASDGGPSRYAYLNANGSASEIAGSNASLNDGDWFNNDGSVTTRYRTEYYTYLLKTKQNPVPVYTVGVGIDDNTDAAWILEHMSSEYDASGKVVSTDPANATTDYFALADINTTPDVLSTVFEGIAASIREAATDVVVEDKIDSHYTMNFSMPSGVTAAEAGNMSEFYMQVLSYELDENNNRKADPTVLENFTFTSDGELKSHTVNGAACGESCSHVTKTGTTITGIDGTYFDYEMDANGDEFLTWEAEKLDRNELALEYFVYLDKSAGFDAANQVDAGTYPTNEYATITYKNFNGKECQQEFPVPTMTWMGAKVTYTFYLVNEAGQPVNRAGKVIPFAEAIYVTDPVTIDVTWNELEGSENMLAENLLATAKVPEVYSLYDNAAYYEIRVYQTEDTNKNYFIIEGSDTVSNKETTKVFNTKAGNRYDDYGAYSATAGTYTSHQSNNSYTATVTEGIDYANTTVAFAVVWKPELVPDTVVVDYGLDVVIDVATNDALASGVTGVSNTEPNVEINKGTYKDSVMGTSANIVFDDYVVGTAKTENLTSVRFSLNKANGMKFDKPAEFYYESMCNYYTYNSAGDRTLNTNHMYSSVTVIPATTVYYEDDFVTLDSYTNNVKDGTSKWTTAGTVMGATQDQDRPGASKISAALDADNKYGHDSAYETMSQYSMGSAKKITVDAATRGEATFTFYGTGFDVISMTSKDTGTLTVLVTDEKGNTVKSTIVDTYYGMNADGSISINNPDAIYQVPVIKIFGLAYGQYTVKITAGYNDFFNHAKDGSYDLYLDAIRIYDPTGNNNTIANNAYTADGEAWPTYQELRNNIITASNYKVTENADGTVTVSGTDLPGAIFIDCNDGTTSIADYVSYGPNNELYLAKDQAIAFKVTDADIADIQLGIKVANGDSVTYEINGDPYTVNTTTDMYYSILDYAKNSAVVTIKNTDGGILSLTNIKVTHTTAPAAASEISLLSMDAESAGVALMMLRKAPAVEEEVPETTVPEETEPETSVPEETEPETEETKPNKEDKPEKETKPNKPGKEDKDDKETKPTKPNKPNKPNNNDSAVVVHSYLNKLASAVKSFVTALLVRWF